MQLGEAVNKMLPRVVANVTSTLGSAAPLAFWTRAVTVAVPACAPLPGEAPSVTWTGTDGSIFVSLGCAGL